MSGVATIIIALAGVCLTRRLLARSPAPVTWPAALVLGPAVGFGALSLLYFFWRVCGLGVEPFGILAWTLIAAALVVGALELRSPARRPPAAAHRPEPLALALLVGATASLVAALILYARQMPHGSFDAVAIWTARARLLHLGPDLPALFGSMPGGAHPDYPLLLPGSLAAQYSLMAGISARIAQSTGALFALVAAGSVALGVVRLGGDRRWAFVAAALLSTTPRFLYWGSAQGADVPLAYLWVVTVVALVTLLEGSRPLAPAPLAGFLLGLLAWTKNEGLPLTALLLVLFVAAAWMRGRRSTLLPLVLGALPSWLAVALLRALWQPTSDLKFFLGDLVSRVLEPARWLTVADAFAQRLLPWRGFDHWGLVWLLAALLLACTAAFSAPTPTLRLARWALAFFWLAWFGVFLGTPVDLDWHLRTALDRLLLQLLPLTLMVACAGMGRRSGSESATSHRA